MGPSSSPAAPWAKSAPCTAIASARKWARTERPRPTNIKCFDKDNPHEYVKEGKTGICRREKEGECFDRVVFRSKYEPFDYGHYLGTDGKQCTYRLPREQTDTEKRQSSDPKRLEVQGNTAAHPRTCDPNWSSFYSENHVHLPSWVERAAFTSRTFAGRRSTACRGGAGTTRSGRSAGPGFAGGSCRGKI